MEIHGNENQRNSRQDENNGHDKSDIPQMMNIAAKSVCGSEGEEEQEEEASAIERKPPRRRGRPVNANAARERSRVKTLRSAFLDLQRTLPSVPPDTKLSKLDVLVLATTYISHLMRTLEEADGRTGTGEGRMAPALPVQVTSVPTECLSAMATNAPAKDYLHPVKKWPMRSRLYVGIARAGRTPSSGQLNSSTTDSSWVLSG